MRTNSSGFLVQGAFGTVGNFQLVVPSAQGGVRHYWRDNNAAGFPWIGPEFFASGFAAGASIIQSNFGVALGNFEVVVQEGGRLAHYWREDQLPFRGWARFTSRPAPAATLHSSRTTSASRATSTSWCRRRRAVWRTTGATMTMQHSRGPGLSPSARRWVRSMP